MSYPIITSLDAEVAYRRERLLSQYLPLRHTVGGVRQSRRARRSGQSRSAGLAAERTTR